MADEPLKPVDTEPDKPVEKFVPQSEVDRIISQRLAREREKFSDYEDLKKKAETLEAEKKKREEADMTESQRLQKENEELKAKIQDESLEKDQLLKFKTDWETAETDKVEKAMEGLSEDVIAQINDLPLSKRMFFINQLKGSKINDGDWGKKPKDGTITLESIQEKKKKGDQSWRADYEKFKQTKGK